MYRLSVPLMNLHLTDRTGREEALLRLRAAGTDRVFLALAAYLTDEEKRKKEFSALADNVAFFKKEGFEVGAWLWTFMIPDDTTYTHMESPLGKRAKDEVCPSDPEFRAFAGEYLRRVAACGVDLIMYDDDFRYGYLDMGMGCTCKNHVARIEKTLGRKVSADELRDKILSGGKNDVRDAFLEANRFWLLEFAKEMRTEVDKINKNIRLGLCGCLSVWDFDGAATYEISEALAGETKPFCRLIGAPYWAAKRAWGSRIGDVIELERMERSWCPEGIEIFSEGDAYPRPRFQTPAAYLEGFDTALRADGSLDGILKYMFDYTASTKYEEGYLARHLRHRSLYEEIDRHFGGTTPVGVRVYESMRKFGGADVPDAVAGTCDVQLLFFSPAARMLSAAGIPTTYQGKGALGVAFGENARALDLSAAGGLVLDFRAAEILSARGVDVGIENVLGTVKVSVEHFADPEEYIAVEGAPAVHRLALRPGAKVLSRYLESDRDGCVASYLYENADGNRFLVYAFDAYFSDESLFRMYRRGQDIAALAPWLGEKIPAEAAGENPDLYLLAKEGEGGTLTVGMWNFSVDEAIAPEIRLAKKYRAASYIGAPGTLSGDKVTLPDLAPFGFTAVTLEP